MTMGLIGTFIIELIINPHNISPNFKSIHGEILYQPEVSNGYTKYILLHALISSIILIMGLY